MNVRAATTSDLPAILEIYNDAVLTTTASYDYEPRDLEHRTHWFADHEMNGYPVFVATEDNGRVTGWSSLNRFHDRMGYRFTTDLSIYVAADARGKGCGKLLMAPLITAARARGFHSILAVIDAQNPVSVRLHSGFGFEKVAHLKQVGFKFGRWLDVIYMQLLLKKNS